MAQFVVNDNNIDVIGQSIMVVISGMGDFKELGLEILEENGLEGMKPDGWYPLKQWMNVFQNIYEEVGSITMHNIGKAVPEQLEFPPELDTIHKALASIDIAYHMNHKKEGVPMFNMETGTMMEGIGHYQYEMLSDNKVKMSCNTPYPCDFDRGIVLSMSRKFEPLAEVVLDDAAPSKKDGEDTSIYIVTW